MSEGNEVLDQAIQVGKTMAKKGLKSLAKAVLTSPIFYIVLAILILIFIIVAAFAADADINTGDPNGYTNVGTSNFSGQKSVDIAIGLHNFIKENNYAYSCQHNVKNGYNNTCTCNGTSHFGKNNFDEYKSIKCIDCSAYVSWVLNQYLGANKFPTRWWSGNYGDQSKWPNGWEKVNINDIQAGDILWKNGHVGIYIGDGKTVEAGSTRAIRAQYSYGSKSSVVKAYEFGIRIP